MTIVKTGTDAGKYGEYFSPRGVSPGRLKAPEEPGSYEVRYLQDLNG